MPPVTRIKKEEILNAAYEIARKEGMEGINARAIAKKMNCSIQPIFHKFTNMEELRRELIEKILETYRSYMKVDENKESPYKQMGMGYIRFAKEEPKLYKIIFMSQNKLPLEEFISYDKSFEDIEKYALIRTNLEKEKIKDFHIRIWIFTHGLATLVANNTCEFTDEQIGDLLTEEVEAIKNLEKYKEKK